MSKLARQLLVATVTSGLAAAIFAATPGASAAEPGGGKHFLWRVTTASQPFYILGSEHSMRGADYPLGTEIDNAIKQCKRFVFEFNPKTADKEQFSKKMRDASHYPAGVTLKQKVKPETYAYVQKIAKVRASEYNNTKPWAIAFFMISHPYYHDISGYYGVENYVSMRAPVNAEYGGLESVDEHIHVLSDMSDVESEVFLLQTLVHMNSDTVRRPLMTAAYKRGDTAALAGIDADKDREAPYITARLLNRRNAQWIPRLENEIKSGKPTMIVVGARHLCGAQNVIGMLQARGYKLEQL